MLFIYLTQVAQVDYVLPCWGSARASSSSPPRLTRTHLTQRCAVLSQTVVRHLLGRNPFKNLNQDWLIVAAAVLLYGAMVVVLSAAVVS